MRPGAKYHRPRDGAESPLDGWGDVGPRSEANCLGVGEAFVTLSTKPGVDSFMPGQVEFAKDLCATCPISQACAAGADSDDWMIRAGTTPGERRALRLRLMHADPVGHELVAAA